MVFDKQKAITLCVDAVTNPNRVLEFANKEGGDVDETIRAHFFALMGTKNPSRKDLRKHEVEIYEIIEKAVNATIFGGFQDNTFFNTLAEFHYIDFGDVAQFTVEEDSIVVFSEHAGNHWDIHKQKVGRKARIEIPTKAYAAGMYDDFHMFLTGRKSFTDLVLNVQRGLLNLINGEISASFTEVADKLPSEMKVTGTYEFDKLDDLVAHVEASAGSAMVVGTRQAISRITASEPALYNTYTDNMKAQLHNTGSVANYRGLTLVTLPNVHKAGTLDFVYDTNKLLVLPVGTTKPIKVVFEGDVEMVRDVTNPYENIDMTWEHKLITRFGTGVVLNTLFGVYDITR